MLTMQTCILKSMKQSKIKYLLIVVFLIFSVFIPTINLSAREVEKKRGYNGTISKEKILSTLAKGGIVEGYVIKGDDLIEIMKETNHDIRIKTSIIVGGIHFTKLPAEPPRRESLPLDWDEKEKDYLIKEKARYKHLQDIIHVGNRIEIEDSEIEPDTKESYSIDARSTLFHKKCSFRGTTFVGEADFCWSVFSEEGEFSYATFREGINIQSAFFRKYARFHASTFVEQASFRLTIFRKGAEFFPAKFKDRADFFGTKFFGSAGFFVATFMKDADFQHSTFGNNASFSLATFHGKASFSYAWFGDDADFIQTVFGEETDFSDTHFHKNVAFRSAIFSKLAYFKGLWVGNTLDLRLCHIEEYGDFRDARITRLNFNCSSSPTTISGRIDLRNAIVSEAHFEDIVFEKDVDFSDVVFLSPNDRSPNRNPYVSVFRFVTFDSDALFIRTKFLGDIAFERVRFNRDANFRNANLKGRKISYERKICLSYLSYNNLILEWEQLPDLECWISKTENRIKSFSDIESREEAFKRTKEGLRKVRKQGIDVLEPLSEVLRSLELNFRNKGSLKDANEAFFHLKIAELSEARQEKDFLDRILKEVEYVFWGRPCGYGTKVLWILAWCVFFDLLFAIIFSVKGDLKRQPHPITKKEFTFKQRLFDFPKQYLTQTSLLEIGNESVRKFINALRFSSVLLFKIGYRDTTISGKLLRIDYIYIVWIEWALGFYLLACLAVTLSNTLPVVNRLITGMF